MKAGVRNKTRKLWWLLLTSLTAGNIYAQQPTAATATGRQKININREWKFTIGDIEGAQKEQYIDSSWSNVHLPHNFSIPYFQSAKWYTGYGWYRKHIKVPPQWKAKHIFLEFEGAFREAEIYINGQLVGTHNGGYTGFSLDITPQLKTGDNVLAVRLNNQWNARLAPRNGDHNFTGGIYRDVYLVVTNEAHVTWYGTSVTTPNLSKASGKVAIQTEVKNETAQSKSYTLKTAIADPSGNIVATVSSRQAIAAGKLVVFNQTTPVIQTPKLWHPQHPFLYKAISTVWDGNKLLDTYETTFGFRWTHWSADSGFFLNGEHYYFKGANVHQDHAGWASAVTNAAITRDVQMIKDCGMDFIRGSHYPHDPAFSDACDSLGILLWEENDFWGSGGNQKETDNWYTGAGAYPANKEDQPYFEASVKNDLQEMIRIHRNHPSVIVWSMCNEPFFTGGNTIQKVRTFLKDLVQLTHQLDPTRLAGIGGCQRGGIDTLGDIAGYNGDGSRLFMHPSIPNVVTEYGSTIAKRPGKYIPGWGDLQQEHFPWRSGEALWCAFDYGTRAGDFGLMGMIDYFRMPKNMWYWYHNEYKHIPPPQPATEGMAAKLSLTADKKIIAATDGTDDVKLVVTVQDKEGHPLSNSPDVTLQVIAGPGEFPTGNTITFSNTSDIYIRDGKAAIEFRSYYGGKTLIRAIAQGLQSDSLVIITRGKPLYIAGVTTPVANRPYIRYTLPTLNNNDNTNANIAYQKPTRASSELPGKTANLANDRDTNTAWQPYTSDTATWWQVDLENLYTVSSVQLLFAAGTTGAYTIALSGDNQHWQTIARSLIATTPGVAGTNNNGQLITTDNKIAGRFLRIVFRATGNQPVLIREVGVYGKTEQ